jgi:stearoyl-CoA desaturase (Delta-9 desaturase)
VGERLAGTARAALDCRRTSAYGGAAMRLANRRAVGQLGYVVPFALVHVGSVVALATGVTRAALLVCLLTFIPRALGITAGFHRYFSHRSFKTGRTFQLLLAILGTAAVQKGVLWWAACHRRHHQSADTADDPHSPARGLWWAHAGWFLAPDFAVTDWTRVRDLARHPELVWLDRHFVLVPAVLAAALFLVGGTSWLLWGFCVSTTLIWHLTYAVNSLGHRYGRRRYDTADDSRNSFWLALPTLGEGWHNNHHRYMRSARQGLRWWEIDLTYCALRVLAAAGIVWDLVAPPAELGPAPRDAPGLAPFPP